MHRFTRLLAALAILAVATGPAVARNLDRAIRQAPVFASLEAAVKSRPAQEPILIDRLGASGDAGFYRLKGFNTGKVSYALVAGDTLRAARDKAAFNVVGGTNRCVVRLYRDINYGTLIFTSDLDWNSFGAISGVNDEASSIQTTCRGAWFYSNKNYSTAFSFFYVPANTNLASLGSQNDKISAVLHDLP